MSMNDIYTPGRYPTISNEFCNYIQDIFAELTARLEGLDKDKKVSVNDSVFSLACEMDGKEDYQQPIYYYRRTDGKTDQKLAFVLRFRSGLSRERRYLASRVLDEVAAEFRSLLFEYTEEHLDAAISSESAEEKAQDILLRTYRIISAEMHEYAGCMLRDFDILSLTEYEKERASGSLLFLRNVPNSDVLDWKVEALDVGFEESNLRMIRKLLAGVTPDTNGQVASALVFVKTDRTAAAVFCGAAPLVDGEPTPTLRADSVQVTIFGPLKWELSICGCPVFRKEGNDLRFPVGLSKRDGDRKKDEDIRAALEKAFGSIEKMDQLVNTIRAVEKQRHGAAVLVADWQDGVCGENLGDLVQHNKSLRVSWAARRPDRRRPDRSGVITNAAKMDGAILVDVKSCEVIALATIVQAKTCTKGKASRGSRYNSINNYASHLSSNGGVIAAFVFSSDGGIDILPQENL